MKFIFHPGKNREALSDDELERERRQETAQEVMDGRRDNKCSREDYINDDEE